MHDPMFCQGSRELQFINGENNVQYWLSCLSKRERTLALYTLDCVLVFSILESLRADDTDTSIMQVLITAELCGARPELLDRGQRGTTVISPYLNGPDRILPINEHTTPSESKQKYNCL